MSFRTLAVAVGWVAAAAGAAPAQHPLMTVPLGDPAYRQLDALARQGCRPAAISPFRPYPVAWIREALEEAVERSACRGPIRDVLVARFAADTSQEEGERTNEAELNFPRLRAGAMVGVRGTYLGEGEFRPLWRDIRPTGEGDPPVVGVVHGRLTWDGGDRLLGVVDAYGQTHGRNDPLIRAKGFRRTTGFVDFAEAYLAGQVGPLVVSLGRVRETWLGDGVGDESLVLSAHGPPIDRLAFAARWRKLEARAMLATIDGVTLTVEEDSIPLGTPPQRFRRLVAGHVLAWRPIPALELTIGETALLARRGSAIDLAYANPLMIYLVTENDEDRELESNENNLTVFGAVRAWVGSASFQGTLLVDDIQIDARDREVVPDQLAFRLSGSYALPAIVPAIVGAEYTRVGSYTYLKWPYASVYQQYDEPLGSELGPDAERVRVGLSLWPRGELRLAGGLGLWRRGAQRLNDRPSESAIGKAGQPFPTVSADRPVVQRAWVADAEGEWLGTVLPIIVGVELARITNVNNQPAAPVLHTRVQIGASYRFRYP